MAVLAEPNTSSAVVLEAQKLLNKASRQSRAPESGAFDKNTVAAIKQFQTESGLRPTGVLDDKIMDILRKSANADQPKYQITLNGKIYLLTDADYASLIKRIKEEFRAPMQALRGSVVEARGYWDNMKELNNDQYIVSWCIEAWARTSLPSESVIKNAEKAVAETERALTAGNLKAFALIFPKAQEAANKARVAMKTYVSQMIDGGSSIQTGLEFVKGSSFLVVGILAVPVAASFVAGAVVAGVVAGAGTSAVETLAEEAGKGIAGTSDGGGQAVLNVLRDAFIGGSIGLLIKGKGAEKILAKVGPMVAKRLTGKLFKDASEKVVVKWLILYFKKNGADMLEGIMKDTMKAYRANADKLTLEKFVGIVVREVATAGVFSKFGKAGDLSGKEVLKRVSMRQRIEWLEQMGKDAQPGDVEKLFGKIFEDTYKDWGGKVFDAVLGKLTGSEEPAAVEKKIMDEAATNKLLIKAMTEEVAKQAKKKK